MRVLILSWEYPPIVEGGLARHVRKLAEGLVRRGVEVHVVTRGPRTETEDRHGVQVHRVRESSLPADLDAFVCWVGGMNEDLLVAARAVCAQHAVDVVHGHDWLVARATDRLARETGLPYVATIHATEHGRHQGWINTHPQTYIHAVERFMVRRADQVVVCSHYMRGHVADVYGLAEAAVTVIPNGIDPTDLQPVADLAALRARYAEPDERLVLLVGRLVYEKGFQYALDALPAVVRRCPDVRFLVAGSGPYEGELRAQAERLGILDQGTFAGWIADDTLHSLYRIADLCVVPSIYEPFGLVALEAMASGCPCIAADVGGLREVVPRDVGLRFPAKDPRALGRMMRRILTDADLRDRLVTEATEHVLRFDWADVAERTEALYEGLVTTPAPQFAR